MVGLQKMDCSLENGIPKRATFGYTGLGKDAWDAFTLNWYRQRDMLAAFDNVLKTNKAEDLKIFKENFYPEDCGAHPRILQQAMEHNRHDLVQFMQEKGLNIKGTFQQHCVDKAQQKTDFLKHPLHAIVQRYGDRGVLLVALLIKQGFDARDKDEQGNTLLHKTAKNNALQVTKTVKTLVDVNEKNNQGKVPFVIALEYGNQKVVDELREQGACSCLKDAQGNTLVHEASATTMHEALKALEEFSRTKDFSTEVCDAQGNTPLLVATQNKNTSGVRFLLLKGAKTKHQNNEGESALLVAAMMQPPSATEELFDALLTAEDVDRELADMVDDVNHLLVDSYCNPPRDGELLSPQTVLERQKECSVVKGREEKLLKRLNTEYIKEYKKKLNALNEEREKEMQEQTDLKKRLQEETEKAAQKKLEESRALEAESQALGQDVVNLTQKQVEFQLVKNKPLNEITEILTGKTTEQ